MSSNKLIKIVVVLFTGLVALLFWKRSAKLVTDDREVEEDDSDGDNNNSSSESDPNELTIENLEKKLLSDNRFDYDSCFTEEVAKFMGYIELTSNGKISISINHEEYEEPSTTIADSVSHMWEVTQIIRDGRDKFNIHVSNTGTNRDGVAHKGFDKNVDRDALTEIVVNRGTIDDVVDLLYILMYPKDVISMNTNGYYRSRRDGKLMIPVEYFPLRLVKKS